MFIVYFKCFFTHFELHNNLKTDYKLLLQAKLQLQKVQTASLIPFNKTSPIRRGIWLVVKT